MDRRRYAEDFLSGLKEAAAVDRADHGFEPTLLGGRVLGDHDVVFLYRERVDGPVLGRRFDVEELARMFSPLSGARELAEIVYTNEVLDPTGRGDVMNVDWAEGLGVAPRDVQWVGVGPWLGEDLR